MLLTSTQTPALGAEVSFAGKTISILVGFGPGGANDVWSRAIAQHLGNHLAGHPRVIVQNAPGAGGLSLMNRLYNLSPETAR